MRDNFASARKALIVRREQQNRSKRSGGSGSSGSSAGQAIDLTDSPTTSDHYSSSLSVLMNSPTNTNTNGGKQKQNKSRSPSKSKSTSKTNSKNNQQGGPTHAEVMQELSVLFKATKL